MEFLSIIRPLRKFSPNQWKTNTYARFDPVLPTIARNSYSDNNPDQASARGLRRALITCSTRQRHLLKGVKFLDGNPKSDRIETL